MKDSVEQRSNSQIKSGAFFSYLAIAINILLGFLYTPWMLNQIGDSDYGLYSLASNLIALFTLDFGMSAAVSRFISKFNALKDQNAVNNFLGIVYKLYLAITALLMVVLIAIFFFIDSIYAGLTPEEVSKFKIVYVIASMSTIISFPFVTLNGIMTSYEEFKALKLCELFQKLFAVFLTIAALLSGMGLYALVSINAVSALITIIIKLIVIRRKTPVKVNMLYFSKQMLKSIFSFSIWSTVGSLAQRFVFNIVPTIIGMLATSADIARFSLASTIEGYSYTISQGINGLFLPKVSRIIAQENSSSNLVELMIKVGRINLSLMALIFIGFLTLGDEFVAAWLGEGYYDVYISAALMIFPAVISQPQQIANTAIIACNKVKWQAVIMTAGSAINLVLAFVLTGIYGAVGAAMSIFIVFLIRIIGMNIIYKKELDIDLGKFFKQCFFKMLPGLLLTTIAGFLISLFVALSGWIGFVAKACILIVSYIIIMWLTAWNDNEKNLIKSIVSSIRYRQANK